MCNPSLTTLVTATDDHNNVVSPTIFLMHFALAFESLQTWPWRCQTVSWYCENFNSPGISGHMFLFSNHILACEELVFMR